MLKSTFILIALGCLITVFGTIAPVLAQNADRGAQLYRQKCYACHRIGKGARSFVGPELNGLIGRLIGGAARYNYSSALRKMKAEGRLWDEKSLDAFLTNSRRFAPGTRMGVGSVPNPQDRADLIAYMKAFTAAGDKKPVKAP